MAVRRLFQTAQIKNANIKPQHADGAFFEAMIRVITKKKMKNAYFEKSISYGES